MAIRAAGQDTFPFPIVILSYDRPHYLAEVVKSLVEQSVSIDPKRVFLFQDGARAGADTSLKNRQSECIKAFTEFFLEANVFHAPSNLGTALNFDRAERFAFAELSAHAAVFLEDDLVLSVDYFLALTQMIKFALRNPMVGYVAAYGELTATAGEQAARKSEVVPLAHKWGFALTRREWLAQRSIVDPYLDIVRDGDYRLRDHDRIHQYFRSLGYDSSGTSQDAAKDIAQLVNGTVKINTFACFGRYIGAEGEHFDAEQFEVAGYARTSVYQGPVPKLNFPSHSLLQSILDEQRRKAADLYQLSDADSAVDETKYARYPSSDEYSIAFEVPEPEMQAIRRLLLDAKSYLEFGCGGSTVLAAASGIDTIYSVDSDQAWIDRVAGATELSSTKYFLQFADIGQVGQWGVPIDDTRMRDWHRYYTEIFDKIVVAPDVVLITGRFRVACAAHVAIRFRKAKIVIRDYFSRPHYYEAKRFLRLTSRVGDMGIFSVADEISVGEVFTIAARYGLDWR